MNLCESTITCTICQCNLNSADASACLRGHIQCQICAIKLNGLCGACTQPSEATMNPRDITQEQGPDLCNFIAVVDDQHSVCNSDVINKYFDEKKSQSEIIEIVQPSVDPSLRKLHDVSISPSMLNVLQRLHETLCTQNCKTFEYCIRNILIQVYKDKIETEMAEDTPGQSNKKYIIDIETTSIFELLQTIHINLCGLHCQSVEYCMSYRFEKLISQYITVTETQSKAAIKDKSFTEIPLLEDIETEIPKTLEENQNTSQFPLEFALKPGADTSVLISSNFRPMRTGENADEKPQPQYELLKYFSETNEEKLINLNVLVDLEKYTAQPICCPLHHCNVQLNDFEIGKHLIEKHRSCVLESIKAAECKNFFLDPSILEYNEIECAACYYIPEVFQTIDSQCKRESYELPICIMICRMNLMQTSNESQNVSIVTKNHINDVDDESLIEAEINEALYGVRKNFKKQPINWLTDDLLIIFPMAPIPNGKTIRTCLTVFLHDKPSMHRSASFQMRSMGDSCRPMDLLGSANALWLSSGDVAALTGNGQHAIQCQLMCKF